MFELNTPQYLRIAEAAVKKTRSTVSRGRATSSQKQIAEHVELEGVYFPYVRDRPTFGFLLKCDWDENGLAIVFADGQLVDVGPQDILL